VSKDIFSLFNKKKNALKSVVHTHKVDEMQLFSRYLPTKRNC